MISVGIARLLPPRSLPPWRSVHNQNAASVAPSPPCGLSAWSGVSKAFFREHRSTEASSAVAWRRRWVAFWWPIPATRRGQAPPWRKITPGILILVPFGLGRGGKTCRSARSRRRGQAVAGVAAVSPDADTAAHRPPAWVIAGDASPRTGARYGGKPITLADLLHWGTTGDCARGPEGIRRVESRSVTVAAFAAACGVSRRVQLPILSTV